jgi:hypothetical protein
MLQNQVKRDNSNLIERRTYQNMIQEDEDKFHRDSSMKVIKEKKLVEEYKKANKEARVVNQRSREVKYLLLLKCRMN